MRGQGMEFGGEHLRVRSGHTKSDERPGVTEHGGGDTIRQLVGVLVRQCRSLIALRLTNSADRAKVAAAVPDDLGGLVEQLPSLRTGEGIFLGEVMPIPSRVRVRKAKQKPIGDDPKLPEVWQVAERPDGELYARSVDVCRD